MLALFYICVNILPVLFLKMLSYMNNFFFYISTKYNSEKEIEFITFIFGLLKIDGDVHLYKILG